MNRRSFLRSTTFAVAGLTFPGAELLFAQSPSGEGWRTFEVTTHAEVLKPAGETKIWLPAALIQKTPFQKTASNKFVAEGGQARLVDVKPEALGIVTATFPANVKPALTLISQ